MTPIPNCPQPETPIRERAWTDGQRLARLRELAELWKAGDFEERECAEKLLAILDAMIRKAVAAEREACAKIAEQYEPDEKSQHVTYASSDIRAR